MLTYYKPNTNTFTIRTEDTGSTTLSLKLENMYTLETSTYPINGYTFNGYENLLTFDVLLTSASVGSEYRAYIDNNGTEIWHGSIQVYTSQSIDKPNYTNQIPLEDQYKSNVTPNRYTEYIIM
jgi:hypothetical protein